MSDIERDGEWALNALRRIVESGGGSESVGCRIDALVSGDVKMNREFAQLLVGSIERLRSLTTWRPEKGLNDILAQIDCSDSFNTNGKCEAWKLQNEILRRLVTALKSGLPPPSPSRAR